MHRMLIVALAIMAGGVVIAGLPAHAMAQKRVALVIGNSAYVHTGALTNPKNDATDVAAALKKHEFQVIEGFDLDKAAFDRAVRDFANALEGAAVGVFFYAGHGLAVEGQNYLVPVDAQLTSAVALEFEMVRADIVHRVMERQAKTNILFLDACRDNPLSRNLARSMGTRSTTIGKGLAPVESGVGTLISFSTQPGNVASDGAGRNSPFAGALAKHLSASNDDLSAILIAVRNDVMKATDQKQVPWEHSALTGKFYFADPPAAKPVSSESSSERWMVLQAAPASTSFTSDNFERVSSVARQKGIPLPEFTMREVSDDVPEANRRFVGVWVTDSRGMGGAGGRQQMVIITNVDALGFVVGHTARGAATAVSFAATPASHSPFSAQIINGAIVIKFSIGTNRFSLDGNNRLVFAEQLNDGRQATTTLERVWNQVVPGSTIAAAETNVATESTATRSTRNLGRQQTIDAFDTWLERQVRTVVPAKGTNTYPTGRNPKAFAMCIDWGSSTPETFVRIGWGSATNRGSDTRDEVRARALSYCRLSAQSNCTCTIVHEDGKRAAEPPSDWVLKYVAQ